MATKLDAVKYCFVRLERATRRDSREGGIGSTGGNSICHSYARMGVGSRC
jgi:predicted DNA-binding helix-hairpin-helix protein